MDNDIIPWDEQGQLEVLTFHLDQDIFAIEAGLVREILDLLPVTAVPGARPLVGSVVNFRGKVIPIADLRLAFGLPAGEVTIDARIVVIELDLNGEPVLIGLKTDKVLEVTTLGQAGREPTPAVGMRWRRDVIRSLFRHGESVVVLPNVQAIFAGEEAVAA
jgi:purine-binding chemotaxis protein CheW